MRFNAIGGDGWIAIFEGACANAESRVASIDASSERIDADDVAVIEEAVLGSANPLLTPETTDLSEDTIWTRTQTAWKVATRARRAATSGAPTRRRSTSETFPSIKEMAATRTASLRLQ